MEDFVYMPGCRKPKREQIAVYAVHSRYKSQPEAVRADIRALCADIGGGFGAQGATGLFRYLTTTAGFVSICMRHGLTERTLRDMRREFYERWVVV